MATVASNAISFFFDPSWLTALFFCVSNRALLMQESIGHDTQDLQTLSRESWAMVIAEAFDLFPRSGRREQFDFADILARKLSPELGVESDAQSTRRWDVLRQNGCDAHSDLADLYHLVAGNPIDRGPTITETHGFDPGARIRSATGRLHSSRGEEWDHLPGLQAKRLIDEIGSPASGGTVADQILARSVDWLANPAPQVAQGILFRLADLGKPRFNLFFSRGRIAALTDDQVANTSERLERFLDYAIPRAEASVASNDNHEIWFWITKIDAATELLSRFGLRMGGSHAERLIKRAIQYYKHVVFTRFTNRADQLSNLFSRAMEVMKRDQIQNYLESFLALPMPNEADFTVLDYISWPDPFLMAAERLGQPVRTPADESWDKSIERLIELAGASPLPFPRWHAIDRLEVLMRWNALTEEQLDHVGRAIWKHRISDTGFPEAHPYRGHAAEYLYLPSPEPGMAEALFRQHLLSSTPHAVFNSSIAAFVDNLSLASDGLTLSPGEAEAALKRIVDSWRGGQFGEPTASDFAAQNFRHNLVSALGRLILPSMNAPFDLASDLEVMVADLRHHGYRIEILYPSMCKLFPNLAAENLDRLRQSASSSHRDRSEAAITSIGWWIRNRQRYALQRPSPDLIREVAIAVSMRRPCLQAALDEAEQVIRSREAAKVDRFADSVAEGLTYLLSVARYEATVLPARRTDEQFDANEVVEIRRLCARVAVSMAQGGLGDFPCVKDWLREAELDPFPEVRNVLDDSGVTADGSRAG